MVVTPAPVQRIGRRIAWFTRLAATVAVVTQTVLLGLGLTWAVQHQTSISAVAGRQGGIFAATLLLAGAVFWLTAPSPTPAASRTPIGA